MSEGTPRQGRPLSDAEYRVLAATHGELRRFLRDSEERSRGAGVTAAQRELLIVLRGHEGPEGPAIGEVAGALGLRHHSAVELVQRAEAAGLVARSSDRRDRRTVRLGLTAAGEEALAALASLHREELRRFADGPPGTAEWAVPGGTEASAAAAAVETSPDAASGPPPVAAPAAQAPTRRDQGSTQLTGPTVRVLNVRAPLPAPAGRRIFVDRSWPDRLDVESAPFDEWLGRIAPTESLRRRFEDGPARRTEAVEMYRTELAARHGADLDRLAAEARTGGLTLLTAAEDVESSPAAVLAEVVRGRNG